MKYKICLIIPYFGKLPNYFQLWLNSCKYNSDIDFLIYTDDKFKYDYPKNVKVKYTNFDEIKEKVQKNYDFTITLENAYKLCDYKVAYGDIFKEDIKGYDFWGHCDLDLIWGDIRKFITDDILENYDKILTRGHFTLYKNTKEVNSRYKKRIHGVELYKKVFTTNEIYIFDEWPGIYQIYKKYNYKMYEKEICADISVKYNNLCINSTKEKAIFSWNVEDKKSKIYAYTWNKQIIKREYMYIHLQKRKMEINDSINQFKKEYIILPNQFKNEKIANIGKKYIIKYTAFKIIRMQYIKMRIKNYCDKLKKSKNKEEKNEK